MAAQQQLSKIHHSPTVTGLLILLVDFCEGFLKKIVLTINMLGPLAFVFTTIDKSLGLLRRKAGIIQLHGAHYPLYQTQLILRIQYLKVLGQLGFLPVIAQ